MNYINMHTRQTASVMGFLLGMAGIANHGIFAIRQGNNPTGGFFIEAIGPADRFWVHGTEGAFTLVHNYLLTGICATVAGLGIILWSLKFLGNKHGATILLLLFILLTLLGGGIGHIVIFLPTWAYATRIHSSLSWWEKKSSAGTRKALGKLWIWSLAATVFAWIMVMEMGIFGFFPGLSDPDAVLNVVFIFLFASLALLNVTFITAIARDIEARS